ncbi:mucin-binding protein [Lactobacillus gasseri]|uniref:mucin-binding protein n=1 Tax=Lactobacillus gasseri TaxID=1596 RepID=UPI001E55F4A5|nr:YSIRK-type signal peptide-containing protein [Lactobacillus gasseri]UFN67271.1 YSIRK-type signal peptide-containing protein [Lactobacillus gasseri]
MLSKNNYQERLRKMDDKQERFSIRKFSVGAASVLVGTAILSMQNVQTVRADATTDTEKGTTDVTSKNDDQNKQKAYNQVVSEDQNKASKTTDTTMVGQDSKVASFSASKNEGTFAEASSEDKTSSTTDATQNKASENTKATEDNKVDAVADKSTEDKTNTATTQESSDNKSTENKTTDAQKVESKVATAKTTTDTTNSVKSASTTSTDQTTSVNTTTFNTNQSSTAALFSAAALSESKALAATPRASSATTNAQAKNNNYKLVTSSSELQQAINSGVAGINIDRSIDASNVNLAITNTFAIVGINDAAVLNLGQKSLNNSGNLTLQDITINGAVSGNGTVNIKGNVTSNVNSVNSSVPTDDQFKAQNYTGEKKNFKNSNIAGRYVNIENGASLTVNSTEINDGINLTDGGTVNVGDNATLNVNLTNASTTATRYHTAGVFAKNSGNFITGYKSNVNFNTGLGQAIAMGATRPTTTDADRFGGYTAEQSRNDGPTLVQLGASSTFNFTGRDGIILGNNANFISGENSNVHFENKGRGVALDLANNSNIEISKHSNTYFHSVGKTGTSGSYNGYNYIGVNEGGNITVDEYATFRVILEGRGANPWDDVISLDSRDPNTNAAFTSKTGAIIDIRDDNTDFYAELISFPLGASHSRIDIQDPLLLNLQRYSAGGATTGWMPTGGDRINTTSSKYTSNLIYMSNVNGTFSIDGTDYVVYQQIKSDGSKQIWLNVNGISMPYNGFANKNMWSNGANPDKSISGIGLTGNILANNVKDDNSSPTDGKDAPYYGISTHRASQQIWFPHKTQMEVVGSHTNTIKYVYEDGTPVLDENGNQIVKTQNLNLTRKLTLDITDDKIEEIQKYALTHNADQTLEYIKNAQGVSEDSGWVYTDAQGNTVTDPYATVVSPVEDGYTASIESSNVPGITEGADGTSVTAKLQYKEELVQNGELSNNYKQNGLSAILPDNYETVVVYKKAKEVTNTLKFYDDTTKSYISTVADQTATGKENDDVNFKDGASTVKSLEDQGYKFINVTDGTPDDTNATVLSGDTFSDVDFGKFGKDGKTFVVHLTHKVVPVTPDKPGHGLTHDDLNKDVTRTINYVDTTGAAVNGAPDGKSTYTQTAHFTRTAIVDKVNDKLLGYDINGDGSVDISPDAGDFAWKSTDANLPAVTSKAPSEVGYDSVDTPVVQATTVAYNSEPINVTVTYSKNAQQGSFQIHYIDEDNNNAILHQDTVSGKIGDSVTYSTADQIQLWESKGYVLDQDGYTTQTTVNEDNNGKTYIVSFKHGRKNGTTETIHFQYADGTKAADDVHGNAGDFKFTRTPIIDTVTGQIVDPGTWNKESYTFDDGQKNVKVINGYVADKATYGNKTATPTDLNVEDTVTYRKISNIIPVDENGNQIPGTTPVDYKNDPSDPTKVTPDEESPKVPSGWTIAPDQPEGVTPNTTTNTAKVTPVDPTKPTNVVYTKDEEPEDIQYATVKVIYHDDTTNQELESWNSDTNGTKKEVGTDTGYTQTDINKVVQGYEAKGYSYVTTDGTLPTTIPAGGATIVVHLAHNQIPVGPDTPDKHGVDPDQVKKAYTSTLHYQDSEGKTLSPDQQQTSTWTRTVTVDTVTNQIVNGGKYDTNWTLQDANDKYSNFTVPVVEGYVARKTTNNGATVTTVVAGQTKVQQNLEDTVVYDKVGKLVPVGPDGKTPIPDAPTPSYPNDPTDPTKVIPNEPVPDVPGYTPVDPTPITPEDPTKDTPVPYTKDPVKAGLTVQYIDQDNNNSVIKSDAVDGNIGDKIDYSTASSITDFENKGYILVTDGFTGQAGDEFTTENNGQVYKVVFKHGTRPVTPENPADPNEPVDPDHPDTPTPSNPNLSKKDLQKTITRTVEYKYADGTQAHEPVKQELTFTGKGTIDLVTGNLVTVDEDGNITSQNGKITWNHESQEFEAVPAIDHDGYYISSINQSNSTASVDGQTGAVGTETVTPNSQNGNIVITLTRNPDVPVAAQGSINYIDDTTGQTIESANFSGNVGQKINYTTAGSIKNWEAKGYNLVSNNFKDGEEVFTDGKNAFEVHLVHATTPVTPENPGKPGEPVNPTNPDDPHKYPDNYVPQELAKTVTRDVTYVYADGSQAEAPVHQEVKFTGNGYLDLVTGEYVTVDNNGKITGKGQINWTPESANFDATKSIDTSKYQIVGIKENNTTANVDQTTGVVAGETVTQNSNNSSVVITLANKPAPVVEKGSITVKVHDLTDNVDLPQYGKESGEQEVGTSFTYDKNAVITELINKGYKLVDGGEDIPSEVAKGAKTITILVEHDTVPVTPENPGKPGEPINPNDPDGPKWPEGTDENSVKRTGTQTIHYEGAGDKTPSDDVQTFDFTKKMLVDKVTGKIIDSGEWNVTSHTFGYKDTPVIDGYHADKRNAGGSVVTPDDLNKKVVVTYKPNGKIIPTDPSGNPIPNVPTSTYPTDPTDPTKVVPNEPVPDIPGMTPSTPTVTPEDPGKDTPVPYNPVVPAKDQAAVVNYVDADNNNTIITSSGNLTGKAGSRIDYSTKTTIADLENKGYVLVNDGFPADATFDNDDSTTQVFTVVLKHGKVPVTPENPGKPGEPINPNDPDGPKWPEGTDENSVKRTGTQTIHYVGAGDKTPSDDVQTFDFTRKMVVDKVTGKVVDGGSWNVTSHTFGYKNTPVIDGYHADKRNAGGSVVTPDDLNKTVTVTYKQNGKIVPVDPSGNPIPNVPSPTYPTDPTDPTKVVPDQPVPEVPGMTPSTPTVTPEDPGKDTPVPYNPVKNPDKVTTVEGKQIVHFVDGDNGNTPLRDPNTQTHEFKITNGVPDESSHTFTLVDVPVIPGYVAEVKSAGGKTVTPDTPLAEVTVVYHKVGKIVPVDPNGNPIPNVPTPSYTNDPTDPTKVVPNEPVPAITGKTPDKTSVTPVDPTKDTPVVYKNNEVPATPNSQKAVVNFIDVNTGKLIKTSGILSGRPGEDINKLYSSAEVIKQLEEAGYEVVYNAFDGDGVTKYFDDDDNTTQQFTVALKLKEKAKTPDPVVPAPETPAKEPEAPAEKVSRPEQPVKQNVSVPTPQKPVEKKTNNKKEVLPQTGADHNEAASILGVVSAAIGMTSLIGAKRRKKDDK